MNMTAMQADTEEKSLRARRRSLFWRIHFWAALIASPFALIAALTGLLYVFTPQIETALYANLDRVRPAGAMRPLDDVVAAAQTAAPAGWRLHSAIPAYGPNDSARVHFDPDGAKASEHAGHSHGPAQPAERPRPSFALPDQAVTVYVNPYTAEVLGTLTNQERFSMWARKLHSRVLQGENWRWMIELAASWMMVMLVTGIYLWWPQPGQHVLPQAGARGRIAWKQWHAFIGVALGLISLVILATGLTWSKYAGDQIRTARDMAGQAPPQAPRGLKSTSIEGGKPMTWQVAWEAARSQVPAIALQLTPPRMPNDVWRVTGADRSQPAKRFDMQLDAYSGKQLYYAGWDKQTAFGKATAIGIPFHRGEFGWWNQALLFIFGVGVLFSLVSGWVMFFKRRQPGSFGLPRLLPGAWQSVSVASCVVAAAMFIIMPLLAISAAAVSLIELMLGWRGSTAAAAA